MVLANVTCGHVHVGVVLANVTCEHVHVAVVLEAGVVQGPQDFAGGEVDVSANLATNQSPRANPDWSLISGCIRFVHMF